MSNKDKCDLQNPQKQTGIPTTVDATKAVVFDGRFSSNDVYFEPWWKSDILTIQKPTKNAVLAAPKSSLSLAHPSPITCDAALAL